MATGISPRNAVGSPTDPGRYHTEMTERTVTIRGPSIDLDQALKLAGLAESGGAAKHLVQGGAVRVNDALETRRRRTCRPGDVVECGGERIVLTAADPPPA